MYETMGATEEREPEMLKMSYKRLNSFSTQCSGKMVHYESKGDLNIYERREKWMKEKESNKI